MECQSVQSQHRILWTTGPRGPCMPLETKTFWISWGPAAPTGDTSSLAHYEFEETAFSPRNRDEGAASRPLGKWAGPHKKRCLIDAWVWTRQRNPKALRQRRPAPSTQRGTRQRGMGYLWARQVPQIAVFDGNLEARCISGSSADKHRDEANRMRLVSPTYLATWVGNRALGAKLHLWTSPKRGSPSPAMHRAKGREALVDFRQQQPR